MANAFETGFLRDTDTDVLAVTTDATDAEWETGFLRSPTGELVVTTDMTGAVWQTGFLRHPSGALVIEEDPGGGAWETGYLRASSGALAVSQTLSGSDAAGGFMRGANGGLVVAGLVVPVVSDSFTDDAATGLASHTGETGATWAYQQGAGILTISDENRVMKSGTGASAVAYASGSPTTAEYDVEADVVVKSLSATLANSVGITGRQDTASDTNYFADFLIGPSTSKWRLYKTVAGVFTELGTFTQALTPGETYRLKLEIRDAAKKVYVDGVERISSTDNTVTAAGKAGIRCGGNPQATNTTLLHLDNFRVVDAPLALDPARLGIFGEQSWVEQPLPDNISVDPVSTTAVADLSRQATEIGTYVNVDSFSAVVYRVPPDQPLVPVKLIRASFNGRLEDVCATGLPIPPEYVPQGDTDDAAVFYQPDYVSPGDSNIRGRLYEAWKLRPNPDADADVYPYICSWAGRMVNVWLNPGHYVNWQFSGYQFSNWAHPDSTYQQADWGLTAAGIPMLAGLIETASLDAGVIPHPIGVALPESYLKRWPAQRYDGGTTTSPLKQGMRFRLPPDWVPVSTSRFGQMVEAAARDHGMFLWDGSVGAVTMRAQNGCGPYFDGLLQYQVIAEFPWASLQLIAEGSDTTPNPTS